MIPWVGAALAADLGAPEEHGLLDVPVAVTAGSAGIAVSTPSGTSWFTDSRHTSSGSSKSAVFLDDALWTCGDDGLSRIDAPGADPVVLATTPCDQVAVFDGDLAFVAPDGLWTRALTSPALSLAGEGLALGGDGDVLGVAARGDQTASLVERWGTSTIALGGDLDAIGDGPDGAIVAVGGSAWTLGLSDSVPVPRDIDAVAGGDVDGDGALDVVSVAGGDVTLHLGDGETVALGTSAGAVAMGDIDGDGCDEVVWTKTRSILVVGDEGCDGLLPDADGDGWSEATGDCDDADPTVHPEAPDACGDGRDDDCDGLDDVGFVVGVRATTLTREGTWFDVHPRIVGCRTEITVDTATVDAFAACAPVAHHAHCDALENGTANVTISGVDSAGPWTRTASVGIANDGPRIRFLDQAPGFPVVSRNIVLVPGETATLAFTVRDPGGEALTASADAPAILEFDGSGGTITLVGASGGFQATLVVADADGLEDRRSLWVIDPTPPPAPEPPPEETGCVSASGRSLAAILLAVGLVRRRRTR